MEHVVFFPAADGAPAFRRVASLDEAVRLVEHLRNVEGVSSVSVHALTEVPLAFRAYYKVEVPAQAEPAPVVEAAPALALVEPSPELVAPAEEAAEEQGEEQRPVLVSSGSAPEGPASLGFFA